MNCLFLCYGQHDCFTKCSSESLGLNKGSASMETNPQRARLTPGLGLWCGKGTFSSSEPSCKCSYCIWGRGGSSRGSVIPASMGFLGKVLAGLEIFMVALFHCSLEFGGSDRSGPACNVFHKFWWKLFYCGKLQGLYLSQTQEREI